MAQRLLRHRPFFVVLAFTALFFSCNKSNVKWLAYDETNCADKWQYNINNERLKDNVVAYLKGKGIKVFEIEIFSDGKQDSCADCWCKTGRRIKCKVPNRDVKDVKDQGFY